MKPGIGFTKPTVKCRRFGLVNFAFIINLCIAKKRDGCCRVFVMVDNLCAFIGILNAIKGK
jgi:hypothetical protein